LSLFNEVPASGSQANVNGLPKGNNRKKKVHFVATSCHTAGKIKIAVTKPDLTSYVVSTPTASEAGQ
jgi:hypothetical protein